ncbi:hypothetical protein [Barrientosiimonas endolithica]|uniref:Uncharacterized protein n=1 Tax=Barrientosiimonas endolithica TaxID=1535208 RepID=A0ABM8HEQ1_9MICO|nr:hypothetical protein [Barrientosiimonas endolithica]BDZ59496.1 hypothetical protein GCM10025872_31530 [Barrientosiimonas endolithica]
MPDHERRVLTLASPATTLVLGALLVLSTYAGRGLTAAAVLLTGVLVAFGWPTLLGLPSPKGVRAVLTAAAAACVLAALAEPGPDLRWLPVALAVTLVGSFLHQLLRRDGRARLVATLGGTALGAGVLAAGACYVGVADAPDGPVLVAITVLAAVLSGLVDLLMHRTQHAEWALPLSMALGAAGGAVVGVAQGSVDAVPAFALGVASAGVSHAVRRVLTMLSSARWASAQVSVGAAALLLLGALPYVAAWALQR